MPRGPAGQTGGGSILTKKWKRGLLAGYTAVILFFMFVGFGRMERFDTFRYSFAFNGIPLWVPKRLGWWPLRHWAFAMGNLAAFIPFGVLIPLNLGDQRGNFLKSLAIFLVSITVLETAQLVTRLGSFDVEDIVVNTLGFLIGYGAWRFARRGKDLWGKLLWFGGAAGVLSAAAVMAAEVINPLI